MHTLHMLPTSVVSQMVEERKNMKASVADVSVLACKEVDAFVLRVSQPDVSLLLLPLGLIGPLMSLKKKKINNAVPSEFFIFSTKEFFHDLYAFMFLNLMSVIMRDIKFSFK